MATTTSPLRCYRCDAAGITEYTITVEGAQQMLKRRRRGETVSKKRLHANARCSNGHEWWSSHPDALKQSRKADAMARAGGKA